MNDQETKCAVWTACTLLALQLRFELLPFLFGFLAVAHGVIAIFKLYVATLPSHRKTLK